MGGDSARVGLIGWPIDQSRSPAFHNYGFRAIGLDWSYELLPTPHGRLADTVATLRTGGFVGSNVTMPHKRAVIDHLDYVDRHADVIGAVNTIIVASDGRLVGYNTDWVGFLVALRQAGCDPTGLRAVVFGAGGAGHAAVYGLAEAGAAQVVVVDRVGAEASALADRMGARFPRCLFWSSRLEVATFDELLRHPLDLVVNATSLGMRSLESRSIWPDARPLPPGATFSDVVYSPPMTRFLQRASDERHRIITGLGMMMGQAAASFELWTGQCHPGPPPGFA